ESRRHLAHLFHRPAWREELDARRSGRRCLLRKNRSANACHQSEGSAPPQRSHHSSPTRLDGRDLLLRRSKSLKSGKAMAARARCAPMSFGTRVVLSLLAGLAVGALLAAIDSPALNRVLPLLEPIGALWLNALRMTVIPLVVAMIITGVASAAETAATGRIAMRALLLFVGLLTLGAILGA